MHSPFSSSCSFSLLFLIFLVFILIPVCLGQDDLYTSCRKQFVCGNITASYPFWGNDRPEGCGVTELQLRCENDVPKIETNNSLYRVLSINTSTQVLRLVTEDFLDGSCPPRFVNSTLDFTVFDFVPGYTNLTFFYGCPAKAIPTSSYATFTCLMNGVSSQGYVQEGAYGPGSCDSSVYVPAPRTAVLASTNMSALLKGLNEGFEAKYLVDVTPCTTCKRSSGVCGYDNTSSQATCYCSGQSSGSTRCPLSYSGAPADLGTRLKLSASPYTAIWPMANSGPAFRRTTYSGPAIPPTTFPGPAIPRTTYSGPAIPPTAYSGPATPPTADSDSTYLASRGTNRSSLGIGLGVGSAVIACVALVFWFLVKKRRKKEALTILNKDRAMHRVDDRKIQDFFQNNHSLIPKKYSYSDIKKMTNSFSDKLGQGGFGSVYTGKLRDGRRVAIKVLNDSKGNGEEFINEVASISRTSHVNIVTLLGYCHEGTKRALIYEYMANGSLDKFINSEESSSVGLPLEWKVLFDIAVGIARGLEYLHRGCNTRIVHFDIKPHNILLDENFCPKISDFGLAKLCKTKESKMTTLLFARGTPGYIAPEVFCRTFGGVTYKSDVYSYGMMVLDMVGGRKNSHVGESQSSESFFPDWVFRQLEPDEFSRLHGDVTEEEETKVRKMIIVGLWCIQTNPSERPTMTKAVEMLEGNLQSLQIPPKPVLSSTTRPPPQDDSSLTSTSTISVVTEE